MDAFDADVLIYAADRAHPLGRRVRAVIAARSGAEVPVAAGVGSVLLLPEVLVDRGGCLSERELDELSALLNRLDLQAVDPPTAQLATVLRSKYRLKTVDAIHLATAVRAGADRFITNNLRDFPKSIAEIDVTYPMDLPDPAH